jgi:hypothetical protein
MTTKAELIAQWEQRIGGWTEDLMSTGLEEATLRPLCASPAAALAIVEHVREWNAHMQRKIAATIVGILGDEAPAEMLETMLAAERSRRRSAKSFYEQLLSHSVVEDIVFAATRWCRCPGRRGQGIAVLESVVDETLAGDAWNTSSYAMTGLVRHDAAAQQKRLARFDAYAQTTKPGSQERSFADALRQGNAEAIERLLETKSRDVLSHAWEPEWKNAFAEIERIARAYEGG